MLTWAALGGICKWGIHREHLKKNSPTKFSKSLKVYRYAERAVPYKKIWQESPKNELKIDPNILKYILRPDYCTCMHEYGLNNTWVSYYTHIPSFITLTHVNCWIFACPPPKKKSQGALFYQISPTKFSCSPFSYPELLA